MGKISKMAEEEKKRRRKNRKTDQLESKQTEVGKSLKELSQSKTDGSVKKKSKSKLYSRSQSKKEKKRRSVIISSNEAIPPQISEHFLIMADNSDFEEGDFFVKTMTKVMLKNSRRPSQFSNEYCSDQEINPEQERQDENDIKFKKSKKSKNVTPSTGTVIAGVPVRVEESD